MRKILFTLALLLGAAAFAQATVSPQGIIVNPKPGDLKVKVWVDRDPHHTGKAVYQIGDKISISVTVNRPAFVYLFNVNSDGRVDLILPNNYDRNNRLAAGEVRTFPPKGARYEYKVTGPEGESYVLALASAKPLSMGDLADIRSGRVRVSGLGNLSQKLSIVVRPVPNNEWASDALRYYVGRRTPPPATTGTLKIGSTPSGAKVYIDGAYRGRTPLAISVAAGTHNVELRLDGYETYRARVQIGAGQTGRLSPRLQPVATTGTLEIYSTPSGAKVYIDGAYRGRTPLAISVAAGTHNVELRLDGYETYRARVQIGAGQTGRLSPRLVRATPTGTLQIYSTPSGAKVYIDGAYRGQTPLTLTVEAGAHNVELRLDGYETYRARVQIGAGQTGRLSPRLARVVTTGTLVIDSLPQGAEVYLDGAYQGRTPLTLTVDAGAHNLELRLAGYETYRARVQVEAGQTSRLTPRLQLIITTGTLEIYSVPTGAKIYIDGNFEGYTPTTIDLDAGDHEVELQLEGYNAYQTQVTIQPGRSTRIDARLTVAKATFDLYLNTDARVFLDGYPLGATLDGHITIEATPGDRELVLVAPGYHAFIKVIHLTPGSYNRYSVQLTPIQ